MKILAPAAATRITEGFLDGSESLDLEDLISEQGRHVDVSDLPKLTAAARALPVDSPAKSDAWLAPRVHALLRLTRREASQKGFWLHLALVDDPDYVRWRFPGQAGRFTADDVNQAFSRLWWAAELCRIGQHYGPVGGAFEPQDIINTVLRLKAAHNRPFCAAFLRFVETRRSDGQRLIGRQVNNLSTAINSQLFVATLDAIAPDAGDDLRAQAAWREHRSGVDALIDGHLDGPTDLIDPDFEMKVQRVNELLDHIADGARIATAEDPAAGSLRPSDQRGVGDQGDGDDHEDVRDAA